MSKKWLMLTSFFAFMASAVASDREKEEEETGRPPLHSSETTSEKGKALETYEESASSSPYETLPVEMIAHMAQYLDHKDLAPLCQTSRGSAYGVVAEFQRRSRFLTQQLGNRATIQDESPQGSNCGKELDHICEIIKTYKNQLQSKKLMERFTTLKKIKIDNKTLDELPSNTDLLKITRLNLSHNQLSSLPPEIGSLQALTRLDLSRNRLSSLPPEIGSLQALKELYLSHNRLSSLPAVFGSLQALKFLRLSYNQLTALPTTMKQLVHLTELYLRRNSFKAYPIHSIAPEVLARGTIYW